MCGRTAPHQDGRLWSAVRVLQGGSPHVSDAVLSVRGLKMHFLLGKGWTGHRDVVRAVDGVDFDLHRGEREDSDAQDLRRPWSRVHVEGAEDPALD